MSIEYQEYIKSDKWRAKALAAKEWALWRCQLCNTVGNQTTLHAHHRTYERLGAELPQDITVLCDVCHKAFHMILNEKAFKEHVSQEAGAMTFRLLADSPLFIARHPGYGYLLLCPHCHDSYVYFKKGTGYDGQTISMRFGCEGCDCLWEVTLRAHKGQMFAEREYITMCEELQAATT